MLDARQTRCVKSGPLLQHSLDRMGEAGEVDNTSLPYTRSWIGSSLTWVRVHRVYSYHIARLWRIKNNKYERKDSA